MIDQDGDGFVDEQDLGKMLQQLGGLVCLESTLPKSADLVPTPGFNPSPQVVASYFDATPSRSRSINFTTFLTMFSDHLLSMDPEDELSEAFAAFDETDSGFVPVAQLKTFLGTLGDTMSEEEVRNLYHLVDLA
jgi:myosin regulatory light chain 12